MTRLIGLFLALALLGGVPAAAQPAPYVIHVIIALTGAGANLGQDCAASLRAFEKFVNRTGGIRGTPLHFQIADDQSSPVVAVQLFNELLPSHPAIILGSSISAQSQAMAALVDGTGPVLYALTPNLLPKPGSFVFAAGPKTVDIKRIEVNYYRLRGFTKIGMLNTTDSSGQNNSVGMQQVLTLPENKSLQLADVESFGVNDTTVTAQVTKLKAAGVQMVFDFSEGTAFATSLRAFNDVGLDVPVNTPGSNFSPSLLSQLKAIIPKELENVVQAYFNRDRPASDPQKKPIDDFYASLAADGITQPNVTHAFAWDPALIVVSVLRSLGTSATGAQIHDAIENLRGFPGAGGIYDFSIGDQHGTGTNGMLLVRYNPDNPARPTIVSKQGGAPLGSRP